MSDFEVIPKQAIDHLIANPTTISQFNSAFGPGRAEEVLANQNPRLEPEVQQDDDDWSYIGEATRAVVGGVRDAAQETGNFAKWVGDTVADGIWGEGNDIYWTDNGFEVLPREVGGDITILGDDGIVDLPEVADNKTMVGGFARGVSQFAAGYATFSKVTRLRGLKGAFINGALADAIVFNPEDPNITRVLEEFDIDTGVVGEVLATDPDDPEFINRLRNAAEGVLAGGVVEALGWGIRAARAAKAGDTQGAAKASAKQLEALKHLDDAIDEASGSLKADIDETMRVEKTIFSDNIPEPRSDADGQFSLDLGDDPLPARPTGTEGVPKVRSRIFLTPEKVERIRLQSSLAKGADPQAKTQNLSFRSLTTISSYDEVLDDIAGASAVMADEFAKLKGGDVQRWASVRAQAAAKLRQMAEITGENPEQLIARFQSAGDGDVTKLAAEIHAQSRYVLTVEQELKKMAQVISDANSGKPYDLSQFPGIRDLNELKLAFNQRREVGVNLLAGLDANRTNIARAMNAMKMVKQGDEGVRKMLTDPEAFRDIDAAARAVADPKNADASAIKTADKALSLIKEFGDKVNTFRINALLSGPGTQEVNLISNAIQGFLIPTEQLLGATVKGDRKLMAHAMRQLQGSFAGSLDFIQTALKAGWYDNAVLDPFNGKVEEDFGKVFGNKYADNTITAPSRFLMTMDEFFKQSQYRGVVFADASAEASEQGLKGQQRSDFIKQYLAESYTDTGQATRGDALLQARRSTFTEPLEPGMASMIQKAAIDYPLVRFFIPFVRTPVNILSQTFQHFPVVGLASRRMRADLAAGGARAAQARGRQVTGAALTAMAGYLASSGYITGSGPQDPRIRKVWLKNNQPYAFRIQNEDGTVEWVSYARLEPLSNVFSIAADAVEIMNDEYNEAEKLPVLQALTMAIMENTVNKTFTQGISDAMTMFTGRPHEQAAAARNFVASFVPNVLNQTNGDDMLREVRSVTDAILTRTHLYNQVDPKRNVLGEPIVRTLPKYDPLGLTEADTREIDPVLEEITKQALLNQSVADNPARRLAGPNRIDLSEVPYSDNQSVYDRWMELTGTVKISGRTLREELVKLMDSRMYKTAPEGAIGVNEKTKGALIRRVIEAYRRKAQGEFPELLEIIKAEKQGTGMFLKDQIRRNRELFPVPDAKSIPRRRSFEDLLNQ